MGTGILLLLLVAAAGGWLVLRARGGAGSEPGGGDGGARRLIRIAGLGNDVKAKEAIRALGRTQSPEALEYLLAAVGSGYGVDWRSGAAMEALGEMSHPRGVERLLKVVATGSVASTYALRALELVRSDSGTVAALGRIPKSTTIFGQRG